MCTMAKQNLKKNKKVDISSLFLRCMLKGFRINLKKV